MKKYISVALLIVCISMQAQQKDSIRISEGDSIYLPKLTGEAYYEFVQYAGEQFFNKEWVKGDILLSGGTMLYNKQLKYNGFLDELIWMNLSNYKKYKLDKSSISEFWLKLNGTDRLHFKRINVSNEDEQIPDIFAEVKTEGKYSFYIQHKIKVVGEQDYYLNNRPYLLKTIAYRPIYYIKTPTNRCIPFSKFNKGLIVKALPEIKKEIPKLAKNNKLDFKTSDDIKKLIELLNQQPGI